jgi:transposase
MLKRDIVAIYRNQNISKTTIYGIIRECEEGLPCLNLPKTGRPQVLNHPRLQNLIEFAKNIKRVSTGRLGRRFHASYMTIKKEITRNHLIFREHHVNDDIMFWPNLASCHYARSREQSKIG